MSDMSTGSDIGPPLASVTRIRPDPPAVPAIAAR
jgi:hypothetical protein